VTRAPQSIAFSPLAEKTFGDAPFAVSATATSGLPVSFSSSDDGVATVAGDGRGWTVTIHGAGTCTITASQAGDANWEAAAPVGQTLVVQRAVPVVTWPDPAPIVYGTALSSTQLNATADTDGEFTYDPDSGTVLAAGTHTLSADFAPAEPANWEPVAGTTVTLEVTRAPQSIAFSPLAGKTFGDAPFAVTATATSGLPVSFSSSDDGVATVAGDGRGWTVTIHGAGTCTITASQAGDANWEAAAPVGQALVVHRAVPVVTWPDPASIVYGTALSATQLNATADTDGEFTYDPDSGTVLGAGTHTLSADFAPAEPANWEPVAGTTVTLEVTRAPQSIAFSPLAEKTFGDAPFAVSATATSGLPVSFSSSDETVASLTGDRVSIHRAGSCVITATQAGNANWQPVETGTLLTVHRRMLDVTAENVVRREGKSNPEFTALYSGLATGDDPDLLTLGLVFVCSADQDSAPGEYPIDVSGVSHTVNYEVTYYAGTLTVTAKDIPVLTWPAPAAIVYGTALGDAQLNASADVPGRFGYEPAAGAVPGAGFHQLRVTFVPEDEVNWSSVSLSVPLTVTRATPTVDWSPPVDIVWGAALGDDQLNAESNVPGRFFYTPPAGTVLGVGVHTLSVDFLPDDSQNWQNVIGVGTTVTVVNTPPSVASDRHVELLEDVQEYALRIDAPSDADGHALAVTVVDLPNPAKLIVTYADGVTPVSLGSGLTPAAIPGLRVNTVVNATGAAGVFSYDVSDGAAMRSQTVTFEIAGVNDPPAFSFTELVLDDDGVRVEVSGWHDPDEGAVEAYEYEWFLDGLSVPSLSGSGVAFAELVEGVWECMVSAVDEFGAGTVMVTDALALCELRPGWNAVAVPVVPAGGMPLWLSPEGQARSAGAGPLWRWDVVRQRYARVTDVTAGGYWVYCGESAVRMLVKGDIARSAGDTAAVSGWHLVPGGRGGEQTDSDTLMAVFGFDALWAWDSWAGGYVVPPSVLKSVHAYWGYVRPDRER
jgi:archaellum component FlaF (FlaF/FlaG flagellin family)